MTSQPTGQQQTALTDLDLDEIAGRAAAIYEYADIPDEADRSEVEQLTDKDVPALLAEVRRLRARALTASEYNTAWHAVEGAAGEEGADPGTVLHAVLDRLGIAWQDAAYPAAVEEPRVVAVEELADADNPTQLRWGLDDVMWGDDDSVIVLMSGPGREPYWLELDAERAAVLRRNLAGPDGESAAVVAQLSGTQPCGHDDYHEPHEWADRPGVWCPGHSINEPAGGQA